MVPYEAFLSGKPVVTTRDAGGPLEVVIDRETGTSKGFGFVEMASAEVAQAAIAALHGMSVDGRSIVVSLARPREATTGPSGYGAEGYTAAKRQDVGYGSGGFGGGRY